MANEKRSALAGLTSLRFFAATYVLLFHVRGGKWFGVGSSGVTLFFVLSGFILAYNHPAIPSGERMRFYIARFARIYPLYFFAYLLAFPFYLHVVGPGHWGHMFLTSLLFVMLLHAWYPPFHWVYIAGAWTLSVEMFFYLVFPFVVPWVGKALGKAQQNWVWLLAAFYALLLLPSIGADLIWMRAVPTDEPLIHHVFSVPIFHLGEFLMGITLGLRYLHRRPVFRGWIVLAATAFLGLGLAVMTKYHTPQYDEFLVNGALALPYGLLIYSVAGWKSRVLAHPLLQLGGEVSYSMYLLQALVVGLVQTLFHHNRGLVPLRFALFLGICYLSYRFIEKPARLWILRLFKVKSHPKPIETPGVALP